jgi:hypothetical protein
MSWDLTGNAGTNPSSNFLGTSDKEPLIVKTNGRPAMLINIDGTVGIGTTNAGERLSIGGGSLADTKLEVNAGGDQYAGVRIKNRQGSWVWQVVPSTDVPGGRMRLAIEPGKEFVGITLTVRN